jgi:hypothetical protein
MPLLIGALVEGEGELASGGVGDDRLGAAILQPSSQRRAVISLVAKQLPGCSGATDKTLGRRAIMRLAAGQEDGKKTSFSICDCVDLRVAPSTRAADRLFLLPPFLAPDAER